MNEIFVIFIDVTSSSREGMALKTFYTLAQAQASADAWRESPQYYARLWNGSGWVSYNPA